MISLTPPERRALRSKAHHLHPVVSVGQHGLTAAVLHEIDVNLIAHELVKVRVFNDDRVAREAVMASICAELDAAPVQHIGKLLVVWRPSPDRVKVEEEKPKRTAARAVGAAKKAPQVRRPRSPLPRAPARPPGGGSTRKGGWAPRNSRRRRGRS